MSGRMSFDVVVLGSGFAGTILARVLNRSGFRVGLIEKGRHPRFALGESSTPLAALSLERLAGRYGLEDLLDLAAWGRWKRSHPQLGCGLKRGFTFYQHRPGERFTTDAKNDRRLLVAASPDDAVADCQWLRQDVDRYLVERAVAEGVEYLDRAEVRQLELSPAGEWILGGSRSGESFESTTTLLIDGTGSAGVVPRSLGIVDRTDDLPIRTSLVYGHFEEVSTLAAVEETEGLHLSRGPYADEWAAVHHLLAEGWLYTLRFDDGRVSAGLSLRVDEGRPGDLGSEADAGSIWSAMLSRYPTLGAQFACARRLRPLARFDRVQHWRGAASGNGWALLPHTFAFIDPLFSTGIAWSLLGVERLADLLVPSSRRTGAPGSLDGVDLQRYSETMGRELAQISRLIEGAYLAMDDFRLFANQCFLYFATVSYEEVRQRLESDSTEGGEPWWRGFLGAGDASLERLFLAARDRLRDRPTDPGADRSSWTDAFATWVRSRIASRNLVGLAESSCRNLYPVDLEVLCANAAKLGLSCAELRRQLPRLRGPGG